MKNSLNAYTEVTKRLEDSIDTIRALAQVLIENSGTRAASDPGCPAQIDIRGEEGLQMAVLLLAASAQRDFCQLATDLGIPQ